MEKGSDASESDASPSDSADPDPDPSALPAQALLGRRRPVPSACIRGGKGPYSTALGLMIFAIATFLAPPGVLGTVSARAEGLSRVKVEGRLRYGSDMEGGGPYAFPDPIAPGGMTGFEVELMQHLAGELGVKAEFSQGPWDKLLLVLSTRRVDVVVNGYEWTEARSREFAATRPYYIYQLQLMVPKGSPIRAWADLKRPRPDGSPWTVGVLTASAANTFANDQGGEHVRVIQFDGATDAMTAVQNGQYDVTLQDYPAAKYYQDRFPGLELVGPLESHGYYVILARKEDQALCDALDRGIERMVASGELRRIYERYRIWNETQTELAKFDGPIKVVDGQPTVRGWPLVERYRRRLLEAAFVTIALSFGSMPLAMSLGLIIALGRLYGPGPLRIVLGAYVELIRGTPLMLQLLVLFYMLGLPPWIAGIGGLAINYSAYEAEIYRAGLQAIPSGQMEAAIALGMTRSMALRRVIIPQAVRIVIPPVTNDFIALFKDTSVCSVVTLVELTKAYSILAYSTGGVIEFALAAAVLYMAMSVPLSWFSRWSERRLGAGATKGGALS